LRKRSLGNLFAALRATDRHERNVLIVLPMKEQLDGKEKNLTKRVCAVVEASKLDFHDLHRPMSAAPNHDTLYYSGGSHLELAASIRRGPDRREVGKPFAERP
jgi:hypothetical protein